MDNGKNSLKEFKEILSKLKKTNNQTPDKIDVLKSTLLEYKQLIDQFADFKGYRLDGDIAASDAAKYKRVNVSKKYLHQQFLRIKDDALFKINHNIMALRYQLTTEGK